MKISLTKVNILSILLIAFINTALPLSFEFRQLVSFIGITIPEYLFIFYLLMFPFLNTFYKEKEYNRLSKIVLVFLLYITFRLILGLIINENPIGPAAQGLRYYFPYIYFLLILYVIKANVSNIEAFFIQTFKVLSVAYLIYSFFILLITYDQNLTEVLKIHTNQFRVGSSTQFISPFLTMLALVLSNQKKVSKSYILITIIPFAFTHYLSQSRMGTATLAIGVAVMILIYTLKTFSFKFLVKSLAFLLLTIVSTIIVNAFLSDIDDFEKFHNLFENRISSTTKRGLINSITEKSLGFKEYRDPLIEKATQNPIFGYGEGKGVGYTMSQTDGAYIDSTILTMWFKNGIIGVVLFYLIWLVLFIELVKLLKRSRKKLEIEIISISLGMLSYYLLTSLSHVFLMYSFVNYGILLLYTSILLYIKERQVL